LSDWSAVGPMQHPLALRPELHSCGRNHIWLWNISSFWTYICNWRRLGIVPVRTYRLNWRRATAIAAMYALALNIVLGAFCGCKTEAANAKSSTICAHLQFHQLSKNGHNHGRHDDDDDLCCKCCGTVALANATTSPSLPLPTLIEWRNSPLLFVADHVLPRPRRYISEPPRGPPLG
jgi:hypothetical protein